MSKELIPMCIPFSHVAKKLGKGASTQKHRGRKDFFIYLKMFFILSFNWIFGICTLMIPNGTPNPWMEYVEKVFIFMFIIFLGANGIVMGCIFTFNSRIYGLYKNWLRGERNKFPRVRMRLSWKDHQDRKISSQSKISTLTHTTSLYY